MDCSLEIFYQVLATATAIAACQTSNKTSTVDHYKSTLQSRMNKPHYQTTAVYSLGYIFILSRSEITTADPLSACLTMVVITSHNRFLFLLNLNSCGIATSDRLKKSSSQAYLHSFPIPGSYSYQDTK